MKTERKPRHKPMRKCVGCQQMKSKNQMFRIVRSRDGKLTLDTTTKLPGRGAYLCKNTDCFAIARKKKGLERSFKKPVPAEVYEVLKIEVYNAQNSSI